MLKVAAWVLVVANLVMLLIGQGWLDSLLGRNARSVQREPERLARQQHPERMRLLGVDAPLPAIQPSAASAAPRAAASTPSPAASSAPAGASVASPVPGSAATAAALPASAASAAPAGPVATLTPVAVASCHQTTLLEAAVAARVEAALKSAGLGPAQRFTMPLAPNHWVLMGPLKGEAMAKAKAQLTDRDLPSRELRDGDEVPSKYLPALLLGRHDSEEAARAARARLQGDGLSSLRIVEADVPPKIRLRLRVPDDAARSRLAAISLPDGSSWLGCPGARGGARGD